MDERKGLAVKAALLHDIGKLVLRATGERKKHAELGRDFLQRFSQNEQLLRAVAHHHAEELKSLRSDADDISYLVYEADNLAAAADRRSLGEAAFGFDVNTPLASVFNTFGEAKGKEAFYLQGLTERNKMQYPVAREGVTAVQSEYRELLRTLETDFAAHAPESMQPEEMLQLLEGVMSYIPSSTAVSEIADISLYDHQKLTAAFAGCLYDYFAAEGITDYKEYCFGKGVSAQRAAKAYLLVSGDISGIQSFIYTIPSKGALKSLRGRSFYLELLLENMVDEILAQLELSRANLLYSGGGHFYLLLPNTKRVNETLAEAGQSFNNWLLRRFGTRLYLALGWTECTAQEFMAESEGGAGAVYQRVSREVAQRKLRRYTKLELGALFTPNSTYNHTEDGARECGICHRSDMAAELKPYFAGEGAARLTYACPVCRGLRDLGERLLKGDMLAVFAEECADGMPLPQLGGQGELYLVALSSENKKDRQRAEAAQRIYTKNLMHTGALLATNLWMGDYNTRGKDNQVLEFEELARLAGGSTEESGIERLGVLRADVDNLGSAFRAGFSKEFATLSRSAVLSRQMSLFFKRYINSLAAGDLGGRGQSCTEQFRLFASGRNDRRNVHCVYSGGDDLFFVGAWDDLLELAVDIRRAFRQFSQGKLTFSAGLGLFGSKSPVAMLAKQTGELESLAKAAGKDRIALFGNSTEVQEDGALSAAVYTWDELEQGVVTDKLGFLQSHFAVEGLEAEKAEAVRTKLKLGKGAMYRLLELMRDGCEAERVRINLARFAYVLARMAPSADDKSKQPVYEEVRTQLYKWYKNKPDRQQLITAIELLIYRTRAKGEK